MSDDYVLNIDESFWDAPLKTEVAEGGGRVIFAGWQLFTQLVNPFAKEAARKSFTLPGVYKDEKQADETYLRQGLMEFPFTPGKTSAGHTLVILVANRVSKEGREYQTTRYFKSWGEGEETEKLDKNGKTIWEKHYVWAEKQQPALKQLSIEDRQKFTGNGKVWAKAVETSAGFKTKLASEYDFTYYDEWQVFPTQEAMREAEKIYFANLGAATNGAGPDLSNFPQMWYNAANPQKGVDDLFANIRTVKDGKFIEKAKEVMLIGPNGQPVNRVGSDQPVNLGELFAKAMDVPLTEDISGAFAHLYK